MNNKFIENDWGSAWHIVGTEKNSFKIATYDFHSSVNLLIKCGINDCC